jgi:putative oxygen-independent coproporphyrinogen III oxidase
LSAPAPLAVPPLAVYVHWPYCARICPYCDFNVVRDRGQAEQVVLAQAIVRDLEGQATLMGPRRLTSIFLGGGTPSLMDPAWAAEIINAARRLWPTDEAAEISLEANPTDAEASRFAGFADAGVQRLSLGVQSLDDSALRFLGRNHSAAEAMRAIGIAQAAFPRVSLDLIYALPGQTPEAWAAELQAASSLGVEHISPYQLTIESGTAFDRLVRRGTFTPSDEDRAAALYETTQAVLEAEGFEAYEVSNHARDHVARSAHNLAYWRGWDYAGAGPGAHGRLTIGGGRIATHAEPKVADYIARVANGGVGFRTREALSPDEAAIERLLLGLRSVEGVGMAELGAVLAQHKVIEFSDRGLVRIEDGRLTATMAGRAVLDRLTADLIA